MNTAVARPALVTLLMWLIGLLRDLTIGTLLCASPLTALIALGWQVRRMGATVRRRWSEPTENPGWLMGRRDRGWTVWALGGLAANILSGITALVGLAALSLPFTVLWLGAWWVGWENSFNKGYEQAAVGPSVWFLASLVALPILTHLPFGLAHAAFEGKLSAFFEWRRIRSVVSSAGWRVAWLALMSGALCVPFFGMRAIPVFIEGVVPGFENMTHENQAQIAQWFDLFGAALAFVLVLFLRQRAACIYAIAVPRAAAGRFAHLWVGHTAQRVVPVGRTPTRVVSTFWLLIACVVWFGLPALIVMGQFMNYDSLLWLTHPMFLLPWAG